jgi:hypothetical protein
MPITYSIDLRANLISTIGSGNVTLEEVQEHFDELARMRPQMPRLDVLLDLSQCTSIPNFLQLRAVALHMDASEGRLRFGRCAIVATRELLYGVLRMFEVFAGGKFFDALRVFRSDAEAKEWLARVPQ